MARGNAFRGPRSARVAGREGVEPSLEAPKAPVLPLDDLPAHPESYRAAATPSRPAPVARWYSPITASSIIRRVSLFRGWAVSR